MKKNYVYILVILSILICSCKETHTYKQACEDHNYEKAYEIVDEMLTNMAQNDMLQNISSLGSDLHDGRPSIALNPLQEYQQSSIYRDLLIEVSESEFDYHLQKGDTCYSSPIFAKPFAKFYIENLKKKYETNEEAVRLINSIENFASICNE